MATTPYDIGVRKALNEMGVDDKRISYDPNSGYVSVDGQRTIRPQSNVDGSTFTDQSSINSIRGNVNQLNNAYNLQQKVLNPQQQVNPYDNQVGSILDTIKQRINNPQAIDPYNTAAYAAAQAQSQRQAHDATRQAQEALGASRLGRSSVLQDRAQGIQNNANEYLMTQVVPQIQAQEQARQQQELGNLFNFLSTLNQQQGLYDTRNMNQFNQAAKVLDFMTGRADREQDVARQSKLDNLNAAATVGNQLGRVLDPKEDWSNLYNQDDAPLNAQAQQAKEQMDYQKARDQIKDEQYKQQFDEDVRRFGLQFAADQAYKNGQLAISRQNAATSAMSAANSVNNANFGRLLDVWKASGKAPSGLESMGIEAGTPFNDGKSSSQLDKEMQGLFAGLQSGKIDPAQAMDEVKLQLASGIYSPTEAASLTNLIQTYSSGKPVSPIQPLSQSQQQALEKSGGTNYQAMSQNELEDAWSEDPTGKASGVPIYDWSMWVRDPRGKASGVSFNSYQQAYGPRIGK